MGSICVGAQRPDKARLGRGQKLREHSEVMAADGSDPECRIHVDADHVAARRMPQLALACKQDIPGLMLLVSDQGVLAVGAEPAVGSWLASGTGQIVVAAGSDDPWMQSKAALARVYSSQVLAQAGGLADGLVEGADDMEATTAGMLAP